jgi:LPXTG-motif cell wall-anchored protein
VAITLGTIASVNNGVILDATAGAQAGTSDFNSELSINKTNNETLAYPTIAGTALSPVYTNDPSSATLTIGEIPYFENLVIDTNPAGYYFKVHFNPNEPGGAKTSITLEDVIFRVGGVVVWDYDQATLGKIELDGNTAGGQNNHSDVVFNLPIELFLDHGLSLTSLFEIFWTVSLTDGGSPDQWHLIGGAAFFGGDLNPGGGTGGPTDSSEPAVLGMVLAGALGLGWLRRRKTTQ